MQFSRLTHPRQWLSGLILLLVFSSLRSKAQEGWLWQWEPTLSYTREVSKRWVANAQTTAQQSLLPRSELNSGRRYHFENVQLQLFGTYHWRTHLKLTGGYSFRINDPIESLGSHNHRLMEQLTLLSYTGKYRWAGRLRVEQRFQDQGYINRWRYRISLDAPLNGEELNPGEKYLVASDEWLFSFNSQQHQHQNRLYVGVGWYTINQQKLEVGLQYRIDKIGSTALKNILWLSTAFYWSK